MGRVFVTLCLKRVKTIVLLGLFGGLNYNVYAPAVRSRPIYPRNFTTVQYCIKDSVEEQQRLLQVLAKRIPANLRKWFAHQNFRSQSDEFKAFLPLASFIIGDRKYLMLAQTYANNPGMNAALGLYVEVWLIHSGMQGYRYEDYVDAYDSTSSWNEPKADITCIGSERFKDYVSRQGSTSENRLKEFIQELNVKTKPMNRTSVFTSGSSTPGRSENLEPLPIAYGDLFRAYQGDGGYPSDDPFDDPFSDGNSSVEAIPTPKAQQVSLPVQLDPKVVAVVPTPPPLKAAEEHKGFRRRANTEGAAASSHTGFFRGRIDRAVRNALGEPSE